MRKDGRLVGICALVNKKLALLDVSNCSLNEIVWFLAMTTSMLLFSKVVGERAIVRHTLMYITCSYFIHAGMIQNLLE